MNTTDKLWLAIAILICIIFVQAVTYSPPSVAGGTIPPCATATRRPTRTPEATPTATPTPTIGEPVMLEYDWMPLVSSGEKP